MEQLLIHLFGDYITQTNWMANNKTKSKWPALAHAFVYTLPFMLLTLSPVALTVICVTHFYIDHYRLARFVVFAKNWITEPGLKWADCSGTGYPSATPAWLAVWLLIIADNAMHLIINYFALKYL